MDCRICLSTRRPLDKTQTALASCDHTPRQTRKHTQHVCLCAAAGAPGCSDLDHWRGAVSGLRSMHHSLVTADLQQSFCFYYSQRSRRCGGRDLCSDISTTFTPPLRRASKWARGGKKAGWVRGREIIDCHRPDFREPTVHCQIHLLTVWFEAATPINRSATDL